MPVSKHSSWRNHGLVLANSQPASRFECSSINLAMSYTWSTVVWVLYKPQRSNSIVLCGYGTSHLPSGRALAVGNAVARCAREHPCLQVKAPTHGAVAARSACAGVVARNSAGDTFLGCNDSCKNVLTATSRHRSGHINSLFRTMVSRKMRSAVPTRIFSQQAKADQQQSFHRLHIPSQVLGTTSVLRVLPDTHALALTPLESVLLVHVTRPV